jgi:hypothetical protein
VINDGRLSAAHRRIAPGVNRTDLVAWCLAFDSQ